jgi:hypothetical protein
MSMSVRRAAAGVGLAAAIVVAPAALAQYTNEPFFEWTVMQSRAIGLELAAQRLRIVAALEPPYDEEFAEVVENLTGADFERFAGTLEAADEDLAEQLYEMLDAIAEGVEEGEDVADLVPLGLEMLATAYDLVIPAELRDLPAFKGGVMAQLLLGEGGVAEGLEEAFEEEWEFANGWAATQRIKVLWADVASLATDQQRADIDEMIAIIDEIYPSPEPPETFAGIDPEEAETPSQRIVGILEVVLDSALYSGRDQVRLLSHLEDVAGPACESYEAGDNALGREAMYAILDHYAGETTGLGDLIGLFAPEVHEEAMEALEQLVIVEGDDDDEGEEAGEGEGPVSDDDDEDDDMDAAGACNALVEALGEARSVLGG